MIHARGLVQTFHTGQGKQKTEVRAVDGVDLDVAEGEVVGFLGPNGAGKTTTLRMLTTLLRADRRHGHRRRLRRRQESDAGPPQHRLRLPDRLDVLRRPRRRGGRSTTACSTACPGADADGAAASCSTQLQLDGLWGRMPKTMSGGQKRRLDIVMGLIHDPTLVFLDEPTTGLDPQARANLWEHIAELRSERGATVFLTTHYLDEADALSDRIVIIDRGRIVAVRHRRQPQGPGRRRPRRSSRSPSATW